MRLARLLSLAVILAGVTGDADFYSVRTKQEKDSSGRRGDDPNKYFHESTFHAHYDGRFADHKLDYHEQSEALSNLMQTYLATLADIGLETWLMHGSLLGWWWNKKVLPWDSDLDVQVTEKTIHFLASYYNMTVFHYRTSRFEKGRDYLLEINPHYVIRDDSDSQNVIDARWIDMTTGLFIDITTARYDENHPEGKDVLVCKDGHQYRDKYIFPLWDTVFEGAPVKIPFAYKELLVAEYKEKALSKKQFADHHFDDEVFKWIPDAE